VRGLLIHEWKTNGQQVARSLSFVYKRIVMDYNLTFVYECQWEICLQVLTQMTKIVEIVRLDVINEVRIPVNLIRPVTYKWKPKWQREYFTLILALSQETSTWSSHGSQRYTFILKLYMLLFLSKQSRITAIWCLKQ
jgi:hypothetical protein